MVWLPKEEEEDEDVDVTSFGGERDLSSILPLSLSLTHTREARRCQLCQVTLANANLLRRHVEDHHFHIRKYNCNHCGKKFKRKEHRERHERIHTGEKPFACSICSSRFTQKEHLKGHIENVHLKHSKLENRHDRDTETDGRDIDGDGDRSSPPSLASPSSIASLMTSPLAALLPSTAPIGPLSHMPLSLMSAIRPKDDNSVTALYAPVTRKTVNSPNKHVQTITINFN